MSIYNCPGPMEWHGMGRLLSQDSYPNSLLKRSIRRGICLSIALFTSQLPSLSMAADYKLLVEPVGSASRTEQIYQPLADYLKSSTGDNYQLTVPQNFQSFWQRIKRGTGFDLAISSGHITDYLAEKKAHTPLVKVVSTREYSLVVPKDSGIVDIKKLVGKPVASLASPSMEYLQLSQFFPNPLRQPHQIEAESDSAALQMVLDGKALAAIVTSDNLEGYPTLTPLVSSEAVPAPALSVSSTIPADKRDQISTAMSEAAQSTRGADMLHRTGISGFEPATAEMYKGLAVMLSGLWGF